MVDAIEGDEVLEACVADSEVLAVVCVVEDGIRDDGLEEGDGTVEEPAQLTSINDSYQRPARVKRLVSPRAATGQSMLTEYTSDCAALVAVFMTVWVTVTVAGAIVGFSVI